MSVLGRSWAYVCGPGPLLGPMMAVLGRSGPVLGPPVCGPGPLLGPMLAVLGRSWALCWWSWAALGVYVAEKCKEHGYLENVLISRAGARSAASWAVLGRSWILCWRSWGPPGAYVAGLGPLLGPMFAILAPMLAVLGRSWPVLGSPWPKSGPGPSGKAIRARNQGLLASQCAEAPYGFFL